MRKRPRDARRANRMYVIDMFRYKGSLTRRDLAKATGLTIPSVSSILDDLQGEGLIKNIRTTTQARGRRAELFELATEKHKVLAVDVGVHGITTAVVDLGGRVRNLQTEKLDFLDGNKSLVNGICDLLEQRIGDFTEERCRAVAISFPGSVDEEQKVRLAPNIGSEGESFRKLESLFGDTPVFVENDSRLGAFAEVWWKGDHQQCVVFVMVDYGVGAGMVIGRRMLRGKNRNAGNLGHAVIDPNGKRCNCGKFGCLETMVSYPALVNAISAQARLGRPTALLPSGASTLAVSSLRDIVEVALSGDELARESLESAGRYLGIGVSILYELVDPDVVYVGGAIAPAYDIMIRPMKQILQERNASTHDGGLLVRPASFGSHNSLMGAAALAFHELLEPVSQSFL